MASQLAPPLAPEIERRFQAWITSSAAREALSFQEVRRGVQALSARYVEGRFTHARGEEIRVDLRSHRLQLLDRPRLGSER